MTWAAAVWAQVGLAILEYLALLAGVAERWMAGEAAASRIVSDNVGMRRRRAKPDGSQRGKVS